MIAVLITALVTYLVLGIPIVMAASADQAQIKPDRGVIAASGAFLFGMAIWWPALVWGLLTAPYDWANDVQAGKGKDGNDSE